MKKFVVLTLFGLLIMALSATVYAQKLEFKASGAIDFDTVYSYNVGNYNSNTGTSQATRNSLFNTNAVASFNTGIPGLFNGTGLADRGLNKTATYAYSRGLLKFDAIMDKNLSGTIYFEIDAIRWGGSAGWLSNGRGTANTLAGGNLIVSSERNTAGTWSTDRAAVEVKNVYIDFGLPYFGVPVPMTFRVGEQPFGVRPNMVVYTDGAGITAAAQAGPITIIPMWAKIAEGLDWSSDDADLYGLHVNAKIGTFTVGGYGLYYDMRTYPILYASSANWPTANAGETWPLTGSSLLLMAGTDKARMWWFGFYADGKAGPVDLNFDLVFDQGTVNQKMQYSGVPPAGSLSYSHVKYQGAAGRLKVDFPWEKFNFGVTGMYATGHDANKTSASGLPGTGVANRAVATATGQTSYKASGYMVPPGSEQSPSSQESIVMYSCFNAVADGGTGVAQEGNYYQMSRGAFGGTWFAKLYASAKIVPWYKVTLQGLYIGDTTKNGNTLGTAVTSSTLGAPFVNQQLRDDKKIGWELDLINEIQIYKNLTWFVGGGYLWAGPALDVYNNAGSSATATYLPQNIQYKNPWNITTRLLYAF